MPLLALEFHERREFSFLGVHLIARTIRPGVVCHGTSFMVIKYHRVWGIGVVFHWCVNATLWLGDAISLLMDRKPPGDWSMEGEFLPLRHSLGIGVVRSFAGLKFRETITGRLR